MFGIDYFPCVSEYFCTNRLNKILHFDSYTSENQLLGSPRFQVVLEHSKMFTNLIIDWIWKLPVS